MRREWVIANIRPMLDSMIGKGDGWEYRRALELASYLDEALEQHLVTQGASSEDPEVRETAAEWNI